MCGCDKKRCLITVIAVAVVYLGLDLLVWHVILGNQLQENTNLWRAMPDIQSKRWVAYLGYVVFAGIFTCIYNRGYERGKCPKIQGIRYGLIIGLLFWGAGSMLQYPFINMTNNFYWGLAICSIIEYMVLGLIVGVLHKCDDKVETSCCGGGTGCCS